MKTLLVLVLVLSLSGCLPSPMSVSEERLSTDVIVPVEIEAVESNVLIQKENASSAWELASEQNFTFSVPSDWYYEVDLNRNLLPRTASYVIQVRDVEKPVVLGAIAIESDSQDEEMVIIDFEYTVFNVLVYSGEVDFTDLSWTNFLADYYPEVLTFETFVLAGQAEVNAIVVSKTDGVWLGQKRVFVHVGDSFYDFSLHTTRLNHEQAESLFWNFVSNFHF